MDKFIDSPWFLRCTALLLAFLLFFFVQAGEQSEGNTAGDTMDIIHDVPVQLYFDKENLVVTGVPETVNMTIEGPGNIVQTTKLLKDFTLRLDLSSLPMGEHTVEIQHENISEKLQVRLDPATIKVVIEEKITQSFRVDPELNERLLAEDFNVVNIDVDPATIEVTGAKSVVESISFVKASITGEKEINKSFEQKANVRVLDRDLTKLNVTIVPEQVNVKVEIVEYNKEVPIVLKSRGKPVEGVTIDSIVTEDKTISLFGSRKVLDQISEFNIDVDVSKITKSETMDIELNKPKGVSNMSLKDIKVKVDATADDADMEEVASLEEPEEQKEPGDQDDSGDQEQEESEEPANVDGSEKPDDIAKVITKEIQNVPVTVKGLDEKFTSSIVKPVDGLIVLTVTAEQKVIDALEDSDFDIYIDASETVEEGEQILPVLIEGPSDVEWEISNKEITMNIELA